MSILLYRASPPQPSSSSPDLFNPHLFTVPLAQSVEVVSDGVVVSHFVEVGGGREEWASCSGATFRVTCDPSGMVECLSLIHI